MKNSNALFNPHTRSLLTVSLWCDVFFLSTYGVLLCSVSFYLDLGVIERIAAVLCIAGALSLYVCVRLCDAFEVRLMSRAKRWLTTAGFTLVAGALLTSLTLVLLGMGGGLWPVALV